MSNTSRLAGLDPSKLEVVRSTIPTKVEQDAAIFGSTFTSHMIKAEWDSQIGWLAPRIVPYGSIELNPAATVLQYSSTCFEGMKAFRGSDNKIRLFRPSMNMARFNRSAARVSLPEVDGEALLEVMWKLVELDQHFIPNEKGHSLYLRPTMIATTPDLALTSPRSALLFVIASPAASYFQSGSKGINMESVPEIRAWPGGVGDYKIGPNYAPSIVPYVRSRRRGVAQNLWLIGDDNRITEATGMNIFAVIEERLERTDKNQQNGATEQQPVLELVTPPLNGLILPGITRDSVLQLARQRLASPLLKVSEREVTMSSLHSAAREGRLREVFGTGTAAAILPVRTIAWNDITIQCGPGDGEEAGPIAVQMKKWIEDIQMGIEDHEWAIAMPGSK